MLRFYPLKRKDLHGKDVKYYPQLISVTPLTLAQLIKRIEKTSALSSADIKGVVDALEYEVINALQDGCSVRLGDLGSFHPVIQCHRGKGADSADGVDAEQIARIAVRFRPSPDVRRALSLDNPDLQIEKINAAH